MSYYLLKLVLTSVLVVAVSEIAKRSSLLGAIVASVPTISVLALVWLYIDTRNAEQVAQLSTSIFWLVLPSLSLFLMLPLLLKNGLNFFIALLLSLGLMIALYFLIVLAAQRYGIRL